MAKIQITSPQSDIRPRFLLNHNARSRPSLGLFETGEYESVVRFFQTLAGYKPSPLHRLTDLAKQRGLGDILLKDESHRLGLNSFKILGVLYAIALLEEKGGVSSNTKLVCATDGNHGLAVAHAARRKGLGAVVYVHEGVANNRIAAIENEGARVIVVKGNYDDSVNEAARAAERHRWTFFSDTTHGRYSTTPRYIMAGYTMLMEEAARQWGAGSPPDVVLVQVGVGGLLGAVLSWLCHRYGPQRPYTIACEPVQAACLFESARQGRAVRLAGSLTTNMAGLSCGLVSDISLPLLAEATDAFAVIEDSSAEKAVRILSHPTGHDPVIRAGESGAAGIATLFSILEDADFAPLCRAANLLHNSRVLVINTEGTSPGWIRRRQRSQFQVSEDSSQRDH